MKQWIEFNKVKKALSFELLASHYGLKLTVKGDQATGRCPLPGHLNPAPWCFSLNVRKKIWQCFGCEAKGNILDLAVYLDGGNPENVADVRATAFKWDNLTRSGEKGLLPTARSVPSSSSRSSKTVVNEPLDFQLKDLDTQHPYYLDRGFSAATLEHFGVAYCARGLMAGRQVIPIHDLRYSLIGYAGRLVDESVVTADSLMYLFPDRRERRGVVKEFNKSLILYNANRIAEPATSLILVQDFSSVWWLWQAGYKDAVALMGNECSQEHAMIVISKVPDDGIVLVMCNDDQNGTKCALSAFSRVGPARPVRWVTLPRSKQLTDCSPEELTKLLWDY